jgi:uncharacterized surface protein with fasciclin (FAS1) repeats
MWLAATQGEKMTTKPIVAALFAFLAIGVATSTQAQETAPPPPPIQEKDIFDTAAGSEKIKTFSQVAELAGLKEILKGKGEKEQGFTVFAPTEEAFQKLPKPVLDKLLADKKLLKEVLQYHVLSGKTAAADLDPTKGLKSLQGESLTVKVEDGVTWINGAKVVATDAKASNGLIHQIDIVLIPPAVAQKLGIGAGT